MGLILPVRNEWIDRSSVDVSTVGMIVTHTINTYGSNCISGTRTVVIGIYQTNLLWAPSLLLVGYCRSTKLLLLVRDVSKSAKTIA